MSGQDCSYPQYAKILHMGLALFGVLAYLTAELAEDGSDTLGYLLHAYLGLSLAAFLLMRIIPGVVSKGPLTFFGWGLFSRQQWVKALKDMCAVFKFKMPERGRHEGLAGLVQAFGLLIFSWMAITGSLMFFIGIEPETDLIEMIEELHEIGEGMIPLYLLLHIGAVFAHSVVGKPVWQRMWSFKLKNPNE